MSQTKAINVRIAEALLGQIHEAARMRDEALALLDTDGKFETGVDGLLAELVASYLPNHRGYLESTLERARQHVYGMQCADCFRVVLPTDGSEAHEDHCRKFTEILPRQTTRVPCPECRQPAGRRCVSKTGKPRPVPHSARVHAAHAAGLRTEPLYMERGRLARANVEALTSRSPRDAHVGEGHRLGQDAVRPDQDGGNRR